MEPFVRQLLDPVVYERIDKAIHFREGDRVPIWDYIDNKGVLDHFSSPSDSLEVQQIKAYNGLEIDLCRGFGMAYGLEDENLTTRTEGQPCISGLTSWHIPPMRTLDEVKAFEAPPLPEEWLGEGVVKEIKRLQRAFAPKTMFVAGAGVGFHASYGMMGLQLFCRAIYEAPEALDRIFAYHHEIGCRMAQAAGEANLGPIFFIGDDIAYKTSTLFSPQYLRQTCIPMLERMCDICHQYGLIVVFHSDGNVMGVLDDLIAAGIDGLNPIEPLAGMDIGLLKRRYGERLILVGNVDCSQVLPLGSAQDVIEATRACIRAASPGGGHLIGSSSELTPSTPLANALAFYQTCRMDGRYPIAI